VTVAAAVSLGLCGLGSSCAAEKQKPNPCDPGKDALTITFAVGTDGQCAVVGDVPAACVDRDKKIHWTLFNEDCAFDASLTAVEMSAPRLKTDEAKAFAWKECKPKKKGWAKGERETLDCKVPKDTEEGLYKYDITGQIKPLDPDIEVRRGN
jgi:hypothetical protein